MDFVTNVNSMFLVNEMGWERTSIDFDKSEIPRLNTIIKRRLIYWSKLTSEIRLKDEKGKMYFNVTHGRNCVNSFAVKNLVSFINLNISNECETSQRSKK